MDNRKKSPHQSGWSWQSEGSWAARMGDWKLLSNPGIQGETFAPADSLFLVNLANDPGEKVNLAAQYPERVRELVAYFENWKKRNP